MRQVIMRAFRQQWAEDIGGTPPELTNDILLLDTGFDSIAFAIFVSRLDDELGFDPFTLSQDPVYPRTFGEFVAFYEKHAPLELAVA